MALSSLLNKQYKEAIRFVLKVKLFNSIKHFKNVRYPFVNVQDIMEKNALCHTETLSYLKHIQESLQEFRQEIKEIRLVIDVFKCINCGLCEESCPVDSIVVTPIHHYHVSERGQNIMTKEKLLAVGDMMEDRLAEDRKKDKKYR